MSTAIAQKTATAGKAGEAPKGAAAKNGAGASGEAKILTSAGVASLLKSEFADTTPPGQKQAEEVQPGSEGGTPNNDEGRRSNVEGAKKTETETDEERREREERENQEAQEALEQRAQEAGRTVEDQQSAEADEQAQALAERAEAAGRTPEEQQAHEEAEAAAAGNGQVPEALQQAIAEWESSGGGELPEPLQKLVDGRIGKLTSRAKTAEDRVVELEAELENSRSAIANSQPNGQAGALDAKQFNTAFTAAKTFLKEARAYLEDVATDEEKAKVERFMESQRLDAKGLKRHLLEVEDWVRDEAPQLREQVAQSAQRQQQFSAQEKVATERAHSIFPWLKDKNSAQYRDAQEVLKSVPDLVKRTPLHPLVMGVYVLGLQQARKLYPDVFRVPGNGTGGTNRTNGTNGRAALPGRAPARTPAGGGAAPPKAKSGRNAEEETARQKFEKAPTREGVEQLLKIGLRSK